MVPWCKFYLLLFWSMIACLKQKKINFMPIVSFHMSSKLEQKIICSSEFSLS